MNMRKLAGLEPACVFDHFEKLCAIPHGSGNTKAISDYIKDWAGEKGIRCTQDELNNLLLFADGTAGYEDHAPVILQGHLDMVCEKDPECSLDLVTQGLDIDHDDTFVFARGTTLGGDDGIAVAFAMALLEDKTIPHPPLEVVLTVDEETGMYGAAGIDLSGLKGRTLINIDSEEEGIFTVSCAGGARVAITLPAAKHPVYGPCIRLVVDGLRGGHSGIEIQKGRANANKVMAELLDRVRQVMPLAITSISGGSKDNAIPRSCQVTAVMLGMEPERINDIASQLQNQMREQYDEPELQIYGENVEALGGNALSAEQTATAISLLNALPNGVQKMSGDIPGLVQTSLNMGIVELSDSLKVTCSVRSSVNEEKAELLNDLEDIAGQHGATFSMSGSYPAWEYRADSPLRDTMVRVYWEMFGKEPEVVAIHAGLECGLLSEKLPGLDCVSMGPNMFDIHTSRERLEIASVERTWRYLQEVLKCL